MPSGRGTLTLWCPLCPCTRTARRLLNDWILHFSRFFHFQCTHVTPKILKVSTTERWIILQNTTATAQKSEFQRNIKLNIFVQSTFPCKNNLRVQSNERETSFMKCIQLRECSIKISRIHVFKNFLQISRFFSPTMTHSKEIVDFCQEILKMNNPQPSSRILTQPKWNSTHTECILTQP